MIGRLKRLLDWLLFHLQPTVFAGGVRDEQQASLTLYSTTRRQVRGAPCNRPGTAGTVRATTRRVAPDGSEE